LMLGHIDKHAYEGQFTKKSSQTWLRGVTPSI
jgi:hypothetical protein